MRYYKIVDGCYLLSAGTGNGGEEISETEYNSILETIRNRPSAPEGYGYHLKSDLTWECLELPVTPEDADPDLTDAEALAIILGGAE